MQSIITRYAPSLLLLILAFAFFSRMYLIHQPSGYVFDEVYHAVTAKLISRNDTRAYEWWNPVPEPNTAVDWLHPPLAKYFQAFSILVFGETAFGWRFSSVIFGVGVIWMTFLVASMAFKNERLALLAALLASFDGLLLVQSRIAMNDIHVTFFILLSCYWYLHHFRLSNKNEEYVVFSWRLLLSIAAAGLAIASKWSGVFALGAIGIGEFIRLMMALAGSQRQSVVKLTTLLRLFFLLVAAIVIPGLIYLLSYSQMFLQGKDLNHFLELHNQTWRYQTNLKATHPYQSRPWQWVLDLRPVWYAVDYSSKENVSNIFALGNPLLFWGGALAVLTSFAYVLKKFAAALKTKSKIQVETAIILLLIIWYLIVWAPWTVSPRIMFFYHYTPAVPFLSILLAFWLMKFKPIFRFLFVFLIGLFFVIWYPNFVGIMVPRSFADSVYFFLKTWK